MSNKRQAATEINHENWDQEDPAEQEEMGTFSCAPKDVLEKRVIRTAKRRVPSQAFGDEVKKGVFSGFGGFNKTQPSSFDFLANLTNGSKPNGNGTPASKIETAPSSGLFSSKPGTSSPGSSPFSLPVTTSPTTKTMFGIPASTQSSLFGGTSSTMTTMSPFATSKTQPTAAESPFKMPNSTAAGANTDTFKSPFGANKSPFESSDKSPFKISSTPTTENTPENKLEDKPNDKKLKYYAKLKGLNESVSDWIKKHVEETPLCILTPIFKDYEKYLKEIQEEYESGKVESKKSTEVIVPESNPNTAKNISETFSTSGSSLFSTTNTKPSIFGGHGQSNSNTSGEKALFSSQSSTNTSGEKALFGSQTNTNTSGEKSTGFAFGINTSTTNTSTTMTSGGFSIGNNTMISTNATTNLSPFSLNTNATSPGSNGAAPFSFGIGKPFSFSANVQKTPETSSTNNDEDEEPPKVEFTPIIEENSVFDKRCKIFVKKDGNFADKGVGTLYIKKVEQSGKHQLLVRANTNLGNVLLNLILTSDVPTQRLGKNNVMMVCIPTPDAKPPPTSILIRVKTSEEADELLETLNKYKG